MDQDRVAKTLTREIVDQFRLPEHLCAGFIATRIAWAFGIGFDLGRAQRSGRKAVVKMTAAGIVVKVYASVTEASRIEGVDKTAISKGCRHDKLIKGHYWKFLDPEDFYKRLPLKRS